MGAPRVLNVGAITGGRNVPSARFRVRQYIPALLKHCVCINELQSWTCAYPPSQRLQRPAWALLRLLEMAGASIRSHRYDVTLLQREMVSTFATLERWTGRPRVLDVDDAIHLFRQGSTARTLAMQCDRVICGNTHLAEIYRKWNADVVVLPTAVDTVRYCPRMPISSDPSGEMIVLGWIGTSANLRYLESIERALTTVMQLNSNVILHVVCDKPPHMLAVERARLKYTPWSAANEVAAIQSFTIGLMPLEDSFWARGKCSFKMLQYMACGLPVVVSPVGMNAEVLELGEIGYGADSIEQWVAALTYLVEDETVRCRLGVNGRQIALRDFSVTSLAPRFAGYLGFNTDEIKHEVPHRRD
mgnify:CR=1 FL=1